MRDGRPRYANRRRGPFLYVPRNELRSELMAKLNRDIQMGHPAAATEPCQTNYKRYYSPIVRISLFGNRFCVALRANDVSEVCSRSLETFWGGKGRGH